MTQIRELNQQFLNDLLNEARNTYFNIDCLTTPNLKCFEGTIDPNVTTFIIDKVRFRLMGGHGTPGFCMLFADAFPVHNQTTISPRCAVLYISLDGRWAVKQMDDDYYETF